MRQNRQSGTSSTLTSPDGDRAPRAAGPCPSPEETSCGCWSPWCPSSGTLLVIPTGGEIPILQGLALAGFSLGGIGALLLTLPAVSLPGMAMVGRAFGWRTTWGTAATVAGGGLLAGGLLAAPG